MTKFSDFVSEFQGLLDKTASGKGYNDTGVDGENQLFDFCRKMNLCHAEGEIVYKVIRYNKKQNPEELLKIAAWAFLLWRAHGKGRVPDEETVSVQAQR